MEQRKETIICLEGLGKQFQTTNGTVTALDDINLEILKGEIFGIIGLFVVPLLVSFLKQLNDRGIIKIFR